MSNFIVLLGRQGLPLQRLQAPKQIPFTDRVAGLLEAVFGRFVPAGDR